MQGATRRSGGAAGISPARLLRRRTQLNSNTQKLNILRLCATSQRGFSALPRPALFGGFAQQAVDAATQVA